jgi:hypothetical protein
MIDTLLPAISHLSEMRFYIFMVYRRPQQDNIKDEERVHWVYGHWFKQGHDSTGHHGLYVQSVLCWAISVSTTTIIVQYVYITLWPWDKNDSISI